MAWVWLKSHRTYSLGIPLFRVTKEFIEYLVDSCSWIEIWLEEFADLDTHIRAHVQVDMVTVVWKIKPFTIFLITFGIKYLYIFVIWSHEIVAVAEIRNGDKR